MHMNNERKNTIEIVRHLFNNVTSHELAFFNDNLWTNLTPYTMIFMYIHVVDVFSWLSFMNEIPWMICHDFIFFGIDAHVSHISQCEFRAYTIEFDIFTFRFYFLNTRCARNRLNKHVMIGKPSKLHATHRCVLSSSLHVVYFYLFLFIFHYLNGLTACSLFSAHKTIRNSEINEAHAANGINKCELCRLPCFHFTCTYLASPVLDNGW